MHICPFAREANDYSFIAEGATVRPMCSVVCPAKGKDINKIFFIRKIPMKFFRRNIPALRGSHHPDIASEKL